MPTKKPEAMTLDVYEAKEQRAYALGLLAGVNAGLLPYGDDKFKSPDQIEREQSSIKRVEAIRDTAHRMLNEARPFLREIKGDE